MHGRIIGYFCLVFFTVTGLAQTQLKNIRVNNQKHMSRVVFDLSNMPDYQHHSLSNPHRFVLDLTDTHYPNTLKKRTINGLKSLRHYRKQQALRFVFDLKPGYQPIVFPLQPSGSYGHRVVVDLKKQSSTLSQPTEKKPPAPLKKRPVIIAIDPGHGGHDPGSLGRRTQEKEITLRVSKKLKTHLERHTGIKIVLTRDRDIYISPNERSAIARASGADFLMSIHADSFKTEQPRGVSVWVLSSNRANREMESWIHNTGNHELLGGLGHAIDKTRQQQYLTRTFLELAMDKTRDAGYMLAESLLQDLSKIAHLHKERPQLGSLAVLKAPDIPSVLVEIGFLSNPQEEKRLTNHTYQDQIAAALAQGTHRFIVARPPRDSYYQGSRYIVRAGDSLSEIAQRFGTSTKQLSAMNQLSSEKIYIGQQLVIPKS